MKQQQRLPRAAVPEENIRAIRMNPFRFKPRNQATTGRQWARRTLPENITGFGNELRSQSRRCRGHELSAIDRHGITSVGYVKCHSDSSTTFLLLTKERNVY